MLFAFLLWSLFFCEIYYHSIFKPCVGSGGGGGIWEGGLRCSCVTSSAFRIVSMIKRPVLPYFKGCQTGRGERGLVLVELVREGRFIKSSFKIKGMSVFFF